MDKSIQNAIVSVMSAVSHSKVYFAAKYLSDKLVVRATRPRFEGKVSKGNLHVSLVIGKPNFAQREFIKMCKKAKEPFPVKKIQVKLTK